MQNILDGVFYLIDFFQVFFGGIMVGKARNTLSERTQRQQKY